MSDSDPIAEFFAYYPEFVYDRDKDTMTEFERLCRSRQWGRRGKRKRQALYALQHAIGEQFTVAFGNQDDDYQNWYNLCGTLGINPIPESITQCRKAIKGVYVNIFDVVDAQRQGRKATPMFSNVHLLRAYTFDNEMIFPKRRAKREGLLKYLLREITD
ncbi:hypothetical protein M422DRAFT_158523 [Sphaerobolus stellatus SS14]|nr:hypothetical protein M422DRAFT_158523 [Sphaerobolus stellatus SS14]